jgi:hypothetical protein
MGRGTFRSQNKVGETFSFQTDSSSGATFDPLVTFLPGLSDRASWDLGEGGGYVADSSLSYTYPDTGTTKTVTLRTNKLSNLKQFQSDSDNIVGNLDMSGWDNLGGFFYIYSNPLLTGITHTTSTEVFSSYRVDSCDLTGNHDMSMLPGLGGTVFTFSNPNLTSITHTASTESFGDYWVQNCNLTGNHDMSMFPNFSGQLLIYNNPLLTGITHTTSTGVINTYRSSDCNITGNHDVSMFPNLGGYFSIQSNPLLTSITHTASTQTFQAYLAWSCDLTGVHDVSMLTGLGGRFRTYLNPNLTDVTFPNSTQTFKNNSITNTTRAFVMNGCDLNYVNFLPLSGVNMDVDSTYGASIGLEDNSMSVTDVNHILVDFDNISTNLNPAGWTGTTLDISGTNAAPDSSSGGFDGIAALSSLTGGTNNWTITTS